MSKRLFGRLSLAVVLALSVGACSSGPGADTGDGGAANTESGTSNQAPLTGAQGDQAQSQAGTPVPQMASGTMPPLVTEEAPATPVPERDRRVVNITEAIEKVPFTLLEPHDLPTDTHRDIVFIEEPLPDGPKTGLPAVRMVYSVLPSGMLTVVQSPATGEAGTGETIDIGGASGWVSEDGAVVIVWESEGVRYEVRGNVGREVVEKAARSMGEVVDMEALP